MGITKWMTIYSFSSSSLCRTASSSQQSTSFSHAVSRRWPEGRFTPKFSTRTGQAEGKEKRDLGQVYRLLFEQVRRAPLGDCSRVSTLGFRLSPPQSLAPICLGEKPSSKWSICSILSCLAQVRCSGSEDQPQQGHHQRHCPPHSYQGQISPTSAYLLLHHYLSYHSEGFPHR